MQLLPFLLVYLDTSLVQNGRDFYTNWTFHQIINPDQVDYLICGDTVIPVSQR